MRKILVLVILGLSIFLLSGCSPEIVVEPDMISVVYENPRYSGDNFYIDVYITNGYETEEFVGYMEFDIYSADKSVYIAGAGFDIDETIPANGYVLVELEFNEEFVFATLSDIEEEGYDIKDIELYFWIED